MGDWCFLYRAVKRHGLGVVCAQVAMVFVLVILALWAVATWWPYSDLEINPESNIEVTNARGPDRVVTDDHLSYEVSFCNQNVEVESTRWLDIYDRFSVFEDVGNRVGAVSLPKVTFYPPEAQCGRTEVTIQIPEYVPRPGHYRLRSINTYHPNLLSGPIEVVYETETFELR